MKLSAEEKHFVEKISALSGRDSTAVRDVLKALLMAATLDIHASLEDGVDCEVTIPYIAKLILNFYEKNTDKGTVISIDIDVELFYSLLEEIKSALNGECGPVEDYLKSQIEKQIKSKMGLEDLDLEHEEMGAL